MAPKPDWNFLGGFGSKATLEDDEADDVLEELRDVDADDIVDENRLRLAFKLAKTVMTVKIVFLGATKHLYNWLCPGIF